MKNKFIKIITTIYTVSIFFGMPASTIAQGIKDHSILDTVAGKAGVTGQANAQDVVGTAIKAILSVVGLIFLILMVYAGILWMTARGEEAKVEKAKEIIQAAVIGLFVTVSAYAITVFVTTRFQ